MINSVSTCSLTVGAVMAASRVWLLCLCLAILASQAAPFNAPKDHVKAMEELKEHLKKLKDLPGVDNDEYMRYWKEAVKSDPRFDKFRNVGDLRHGQDKVDMERLVENNPHLSDRLAKHSDDIRSRLEEAKRMNIEQMRQLQRLQELRNDHVLKEGDWNTKLEGLREKLPPKFTDQDIQDRIREQNRLMGQIDTERHEEFKKMEMQAEHRRRELLRAMDEKKRLQADEEFRRKQEKLRTHDKLHHPASEEQLEDVWEKQDGLDRDKFDPKTFFHLHDKNSDRHLDAMEWESLFYTELRKVYGDDMGGMEAHEDLARMREHVIREMDRDNDGMISLEEFLKYTKKPDFKEDEEWKSVVEEDTFDEDEFKKYEEEYPDYYDYEYDDNGNLIGYNTKQKGTANEEEVPDKKPPQVHEEGQPPNEQGPPSNEQGQPPNKQGLPPNEQGQPPHEDRGVPGQDKPQIDDPKAVHFEDPNVDGRGNIPQGNDNL